MGYPKEAAGEAAKNVSTTEEAIDWLDTNMEDPANITQSIVDDITASPSPKRRRKNDGETDVSKPKIQIQKPVTQKATAARKDPFVLQIKKGNVTRCQGCREEFGKVEPSANVVVQHKNQYPYFNPTLGIVINKWSNGNYHANVGCIKPRFLDFDPREVTVSPETRKALTQAHVNYCKQHGILWSVGVLD
ncbi:uncharacterized protein LOC144915010 [Branchiostoma floridae x Branchiostoma belcheri]